MFSDLATYILSFSYIGNDTNLYNSVHFFIEDTTKIFTMLAAIMFCVSYLRKHIDFEKLSKYLQSKNKFIGHLIAAILGSITPFCSCSSISIFIGFIESKVPFGIAMSFLITSPLINEVAIALLLPIIGFKATFLYVGTGIFIGIFAGMLMNRFYNREHINEEIYDHRENGDLSKLKNEKIDSYVKYAINYTIETISGIWIYIMIGIGIGAFIHGYIPKEFFIEHLNGKSWYEVPLTVLIGIPLYTNATGIIPFVEVLLEKGMQIGTVFALMMSTVGLSLPEFILLKRVFKVKMIAKMIGILGVIFILTGYFYNIIL